MEMGQVGCYIGYMHAVNTGVERCFYAEINESLRKAERGKVLYKDGRVMDGWVGVRRG